MARNVTIVRRATQELAGAESISAGDVEALQSTLLEDEQRHHGFRTQQNWIGGGLWSPVNAEFVPPPPEELPRLMDDLFQYLNGATHGTLIQAALVHAQFETLHPFTDGNGRVGRALLHTVLARRGLTEHAVIPVSLVLATLSDDYVRGLTAFRHHYAPSTAEGNRAVGLWLDTFLRAMDLAVDQAEAFVADVEALRQEWETRLASHRSAQGLRANPRAGSSAQRILTALPEAPVLTATTARRTHGVTVQAANVALDELASAGILSRKKIDRGATAFIATEVLELVTLRERALASTRFDTRQAPPRRPVPALPQR